MCTWGAGVVRGARRVTIHRMNGRDAELVDCKIGPSGEGWRWVGDWDMDETISARRRAGMGWDRMR